VFTGIAEFAVNPPQLITGENYAQRDPRSGLLFGSVRINVFNISKINSEVRGGKSLRIKRLSEYIGESYFEYLARLPDLVLLMDESSEPLAGHALVAGCEHRSSQRREGRPARAGLGEPSAALRTRRGARLPLRREPARWQPPPIDLIRMGRIAELMRAIRAERADTFA
jgi:hypothetical protein